MLPCDAMFPISVYRLDLPQSALSDWTLLANISYNIPNGTLSNHIFHKTEKNIFYVYPTKNGPVTYTVDHKFD